MKFPHGLRALNHGDYRRFYAAQLWRLAAGIVLVASCTTAMQLIAPDALRGRVMSLYTWVYGGVFPIGAFLVGAISQAASVSTAFLCAGSFGLLALAGLMLWWARRRN